MSDQGIIGLLITVSNNFNWFLILKINFYSFTSKLVTEGLIEKLPSTTGARDNHRDKGTVCPRTNWVAAALKKGSKAA